MSSWKKVIFLKKIIVGEVIYFSILYNKVST